MAKQLIEKEILSMILDWNELNSGVAGVKGALKGAEWVFRKDPKIKQRILS